MKKTLLFLTAFLVMGSFAACTKSDSNDDNPINDTKSGEGNTSVSYYTDKGEKLVFNIRKDKVIIKTKSDADAKELTKQDIFLSDRPAYDVAGCWVIATIDSVKTQLNDIMQLSGVVDAAYGLEYGKDLHYPSNQIFLQCSAPEDVLARIGLAKNVESIELINPYSTIYLITLNVKLGDIVKICRNLYESGLCHFAEPVFFREMRRM